MNLQVSPRYDSIWMSCDTDYSHQKNGCKPPQKRRSLKQEYGVIDIEM